MEARFTEQLFHIFGWDLGTVGDDESHPINDLFDSPQAREGRRGHQWIAQTLTMLLDARDGWDDVDEAVDSLEALYRDLSEWTRACVRRCVSYAVALHRKLLGQGWDRVKVQIERKLSGAATGIPRGGTADLIFVCRGAQARKVVIVDWKLGFLDQGAASHSKQLTCYAVMAYDKWHPEEVEIHMAQGRRRSFTATNYPEDIMEVLRVSISDLANLARGQAYGRKPQLTCCLEACRYCRAFPLCRVARKRVNEGRIRIMDALHEIALFGTEPPDLVQLDEDIRLCRRFAEAGKELQKKLAEAQTAQTAPKKGEDK
jgi:hypothetical protein